MILVDKLVNYRIVEPTHVLSWIFEADGGQRDFQRSYVWTILKSVMGKVSARVQRIAHKLETTRASMVAEDSMHMQTDDGDATGDDDKEKPVKPGQPGKSPATQDDVDDLESKLDSAQREKKKMFMDVFQHFLRVLQPCLGTPEEHTTWFQWTEGMFREMGRYVSMARGEGGGRGEGSLGLLTWHHLLI